MAEIVPAIIPKSFAEIEDKVSQVLGYVDTVSIDIVDGVFAPVTTWPFDGGDSYAFQNMLDGNQLLPYAEQIRYELDMMVSGPREHLDNWLELGVSSFVIHNESCEGDIFEIVRILTEHGKQVGVAIKPRESLEVLESFISEIDFVQLMGNDNIGHNGVKLDDTVYEKIRTVKDMYPYVTISIDIGVNRETAPRLVEAGATKLVSGSGIFGAEDPVGEINFYENLK